VEDTLKKAVFADGFHHPSRWDYSAALCTADNLSKHR